MVSPWPFQRLERWPPTRGIKRSRWLNHLRFGDFSFFTNGKEATFGIFIPSRFVFLGGFSVWKAWPFFQAFISGHVNPPNAELPQGGPQPASLNGFHWGLFHIISPYLFRSDICIHVFHDLMSSAGGALPNQPGSTESFTFEGQEVLRRAVLRLSDRVAILGWVVFLGIEKKLLEWVVFYEDIPGVFVKQRPS